MSHGELGQDRASQLPDRLGRRGGRRRLRRLAIPPRAAEPAGDGRRRGRAEPLDHHRPAGRDAGRRPRRDGTGRLHHPARAAGRGTGRRVGGCARHPRTRGAGLLQRRPDEPCLARDRLRPDGLAGDDGRGDVGPAQDDRLAGDGRLDLDAGRLREAAAGGRDRARSAETGRRRAAGPAGGGAVDGKRARDRAGRDRAELCRAGARRRRDRPAAPRGAEARVLVEIPRPVDAAARHGGEGNRARGIRHRQAPAGDALRHGADVPAAGGRDARLRRLGRRGDARRRAGDRPRDWRRRGRHQHLACHARRRGGRNRLGARPPTPRPRRR